jgi:nitrate/TMAO reductase-like tetraheme cytochrome c subunit
VSLFRRRERRPAPEAESTSPSGRLHVSPGERRVFVVSASVLGVATVGVLLFSAGSFWWTSQPSFCNGCHVMNKYVQTWSASAHQDVNCEKCHLTPGLFGFLGGKIAGLQVVMNYIRGDYEDYSFSAAVSNASCLQCHRSIMDKNVHDARAGVIVSHRNIVEAGGKCVSCHSTVAHGDAIPIGSATHPSMQTCLTCHNNDTAPLRCSLCHVGREPPSEPPPISPAAGSAGG